MSFFTPLQPTKDDGTRLRTDSKLVDVMLPEKLIFKIHGVEKLA